MGIVNSHKGAIRIRTAEGKGTTFRILFPLSRKTCTEIRKKVIPLIDHHGTGLILVIDDDPTVRRVTRAILKEYGYGVITCSTGASAINVFRKRAEAIDCVILDLTLPEISGQELFRQLKEISPDVRVLLSSGHSSERIDEKFPRGSVDGFLKKPYDIATFLEKLREVLATD
jgi:CheY-like chemotaxis protein